MVLLFDSVVVKRKDEVRAGVQKEGQCNKKKTRLPWPSVTRNVPFQMGKNRFVRTVEIMDFGIGSDC